MVYNYLTSGIAIGSEPVEIAPFIHGSITTFIKVMIILGGATASLIALVMIARRLSKKNVFARILPHGLILLLFLAGYLVIFTAPTGKPKPVVTEPKASISIAQAMGETRGGTISVKITLL